MTQKDSSIPLTLEQLMQSTGATQSNAQKYHPFLQGAAKAYGITSRIRLAAFLSQIAVESGLLSVITENLNYSVAGLRNTWPKRFPTEDAARPYARNPEKLANNVYANRMGNGSAASGDGWRYRGRGLKQLTGKHNYMMLSNHFGVDFLSDPDLLLHPVWASISAAWYWNRANCSYFADKGDIVGLTKAINGGFNGLERRQLMFQKSMKALENYSY